MIQEEVIAKMMNRVIEYWGFEPLDISSDSQHLQTRNKWLKAESYHITENSTCCAHTMKTQ